MGFYPQFKFFGSVEAWQRGEHCVSLYRTCESIVPYWKEEDWGILKQTVENWWRNNQSKEVDIYCEDNGFYLKKRCEKLYPAHLFQTYGSFAVLVETSFKTWTSGDFCILVIIDKDDQGLYATFHASDKDAFQYPSRSLINQKDTTNIIHALAYLQGKSFVDNSFFIDAKANFYEWLIRSDEETFIHDSHLQTVINIPGDDDIRPGLEIYLKFYPNACNDKEWNIDLAFGDSLLTRRPIECLPRLYRIVKPSAFNKDTDIVGERFKGKWRDLLEIADTDSWSGNHEVSVKVFIELTFERLCSDQAHQETRVAREFPPFVPPLPLQGERSGTSMPTETLFCTGLTKKKTGSYIYCKLSDPDSADNPNRYCRIEWITKDDPTLHLDVALSPYHHGLPLPASWAREAERLVFDYRYGSLKSGLIEIDYAHLFFDHVVKEMEMPEGKRRFPASITNRYLKYKNFRSPDGSEGKGRSQYVPKDFVELIDNAWRKARKRLQSNYTFAIPTFYRGQIQLLVPLYLEKPDSPNPTVALVVQLTSKKEREKYNNHYWCPTCLTLEMARNNSRVINPLAGTWLKE